MAHASVKQHQAPLQSPEAFEVSHGENPAQIARRLAKTVADAADADQWAIAVVGLKGTGRADFEELVPREWLGALNTGRPAAYRLTLVLQAAGRDLGIIRLGTLRPDGFSPENVARARQAANRAAVELGLALDRETPSVPRAAVDGVIVLDADRRIRIVTPGTERLLGWREEEVVGGLCEMVFDCHDQAGARLCGRCGLDAAFRRREYVPAARVMMATSLGSRREMKVSYWYVPPAECGAGPRAIAFLHDPSGDGG